MHARTISTSGYKGKGRGGGREPSHSLAPHLVQGAVGAKVQALLVGQDPLDEAGVAPPHGRHVDELHPRVVLRPRGWGWGWGGYTRRKRASGRVNSTGLIQGTARASV